MQQPTLAPAPHSHTSLQDTASSAEQSWYPEHSSSDSIVLFVGSCVGVGWFGVSVTDKSVPIALRAHLLPHISPSQNTTAGTAPPSSGTAVGSDSPREVNPNIDPAISGVGVGSQQQAQQQQLPQQQQPILQQPIQQQPVQHAIQQQVPQQMQQMQQMQHQHPQSPGVQNMQMAASPVMSQGMTLDQQHSQSQSGAEESEQPKARGGKRELSTSKRAAQNRAAQRAFRQRKEGYIKKLEEQVRDFTAMQESYKQIQSENYQLRDYIINIQSRLIESQGEDAVPPPPPVFLHPAPPLMLLDTSQTTGTPQPTQPSQQVSQGQVQLPGAPAPAMQAQSVLQVPHGVPIAAAPAHQPVISEIAAAGQKRAHDDTDNAFLQSIAQAAGTTGNGFIPVSQPPLQAAPPPPQQQHTPRKSTSPAAKRVKGEKLEAKAEAENVNGA